jgi:hypothetical protein
VLSTVSIAAGKTSLTSKEAEWLLVAMLATWLLAGALLWGVRATVKSSDNEAQSFLRGWLATTLVLVLSVACIGAFELDDAQLRNTLIGGIVASAGTAIAFYFSSKGADAARKDLLKTATALAQGGSAPSAFSSPAPPAGTVGTPYLHKFVVDGTPPIEYEISSGALPGGLALQPDGSLTGTPTTQESATFAVTAKNALGSVSSPAITLQINP